MKAMAFIASLEVSLDEPRRQCRFLRDQVGLGRDGLDLVGKVHRHRHLEDARADLPLHAHAPGQPDLEVPQTILNRHHRQVEGPRFEQARHVLEGSPVVLLLQLRDVAHGIELPTQSIDRSHECAGLGLDPEAAADAVDIRLARKHVQLNDLEPAAIGE
jgi:hypothetical protein